MNSKPVELDQIEREILQLEIERAAIKRENNESRLKEIEKELASVCIAIWSFFFVFVPSCSSSINR